MVNNTKSGHSSIFWLTFRMILYLLFSLFFVLIAVPMGFHKLGKLVFSSIVFSWFEHGIAQKIIGIVIFIVSLSGYLTCSLWLVISGKGPYIEFDPPQKLVSTGPYRWTRNPVATFLLASVLGEAVFFSSPGILLQFIFGILIAHLQVILIEEPRLYKRFGKDYHEYCQQVPRWIPFFKRGRRPQPKRPPNQLTRLGTTEKFIFFARFCRRLIKNLIFKSSIF